MSKVKEVFLYILALIVLLAPAIILGWIGLSLTDGLGLGWLGLLVGVIVGLVIFVASVNKIGALAEDDEEPVVTTEGQLSLSATASPETVTKES